MISCETWSARVWRMAHVHADENQKWRMRFFVLKAREANHAANDELRLHFLHLFHLVAEEVMTKSLKLA